MGKDVEKSNIALDEWMAEMDRLSDQKTCDGMTVEDIMARTGKSQKYVYKMIRSAIECGKCQVVKIPKIRIDGIRMTVPGYVFK